MPKKLDREVVYDLGIVFEDEGARLWRAIFAYSQSREITDDAVAEAFAQCLRRGDAVDDPRAWVWTAAFRIAGGELRDRGRSSQLPEVPVDQPMDDDPDRLVRALGVLPTNQRAVLVLCGYAGYRTDEVAEMLGIGRATVRVHLSRGRRRLRQLLDEEG